MPAGAYGWAGVVLGCLAILVVIFYQIRKRVSIEMQAERETRARLDAERKAEEYKRVAEIRARPLGPSPGLRVRDIPKGSDDPASGPPDH